MHIEKYWNSLEYSLQERGAYWHWHHSGTSGTQFYFKGKVWLCGVIIFWQLQLLANTFNALQVSRVNKMLILKHENWRWRYYKHCYRYAATLIFKFTHLDILQRTPIKIAAKYVTRVIKLLPSQFGEKNKTAQLHYSCVWVTVKLFYFTYAVLLEATDVTSPPNMSEELKFDFQSSPDVFKDHWSNMAAMQNNFCQQK